MTPPPSRQPRRPTIKPDSTGMHLRKILVPVDFLESTIRVLQYAAAFARQYHASLTLLHCIKPEKGDLRREIPREQLIHELTEAAEKQIRHLTDVLWADEIPTEIMIATGKPHQQIVNEAKEMSSDLIIMGGHGWVGSWGLFRRNTAVKVVRYAPCPVLVVRAWGNGFVPESFPPKSAGQ